MVRHSALLPRLGWHGLNMAITLDGRYPVCTTVRRLEEPIIRCISEDCGEVVADIHTKRGGAVGGRTGCPFVITRAALGLTGIVQPGEELATTLAARGGLKIRTEVQLPMGSGLGTSSILAVTVLRALSGLLGVTLSDEDLNKQVLRLEQALTTGGGWQDQAGALFAGTKLISSDLGRNSGCGWSPTTWSRERQEEFASASCCTTPVYSASPGTC